jgi:hypothetical protein
LIVAMCLCTNSSPVPAQTAHAGPWDPAAEAAAESAVALIGAKRALDIHASVLSIPALAPQ